MSVFTALNNTIKQLENLTLHHMGKTNWDKRTSMLKARVFPNYKNMIRII